MLLIAGGVKLRLRQYVRFLFKLVKRCSSCRLKNCVQKEGEFVAILRLHGDGDSRLIVVMPRCCKTLYMDANGIQNV